MEIYPWVTGVLVVSLYKIQECGSLWGKKGITQITQGKTVKKKKDTFLSFEREYHSCKW